MSAVMKELGGALSLRGGLSALCINIVDSEFGPAGTTAAGMRAKVRSFIIKRPFVCFVLCYIYCIL